MAEFGRRRPQGAGVARAAPRPAAPADLASAAAALRSGRLPRWAKTGPLRLAVVLLAAAGALCALASFYGGDLRRDHRLAGTWQPAYDLRVAEGRCTRYQLVLTLCEAQVRSLPEPGRPPLAASAMMAFAGGGGERLVAVRSAVDPSAVAVAYFAEAELLNRTLTLAALSVGLAAVLLWAASSILRGRYVGGTAHRELLAGLEELAGRPGPAQLRTVA